MNSSFHMGFQERTFDSLVDSKLLSLFLQIKSYRIVDPGCNIKIFSDDVTVLKMKCRAPTKVLVLLTLLPQDINWQGYNLQLIKKKSFQPKTSQIFCKCNLGFQNVMCTAPWSTNTTLRIYGCSSTLRVILLYPLKGTLNTQEPWVFYISNDGCTVKFIQSLHPVRQNIRSQYRNSE